MIAQYLEFWRIKKKSILTSVFYFLFMKNIRKYLPSCKILNKKTWLYVFLYYYFKGTLIEIVRVLEEVSGLV